MKSRLVRFVDEVEAALADKAPEDEIIDRVSIGMAELVSKDDWLPLEFAQPHPHLYQQYPLHRDLRGRFSVVSFVWGKGQRTPIHDHTVWGVIGMLRGSECTQCYHRSADGLQPYGAVKRLQPGDVAAVSPIIGDIHQVSNAFDDRVSISIHAYGTDIGTRTRHVFDPTSGALKDFVSGYANVGCNAK